MKFPGHFVFEKLVLLGVKAFHGLQDYPKNIWKNLTAGRYPVQKICPRQKTASRAHVRMEYSLGYHQSRYVLRLLRIRPRRYLLPGHLEKYFTCRLNAFLGVRISSTFSVLRPFYFEPFTSTRLLRRLYFDLLTNLDILLVEKYRSK